MSAIVRRTASTLETKSGRANARPDLSTWILSLIEFPDVSLNVLPGPGEGAGGLHLQRDAGGGIQQGLLHVRAQHPHGQVGAEGGVAPAGATREVPGLDGAGAVPLSVISQDLAVMGDNDLLGAPLMELAGGLEPPAWSLQVTCSTNWATPALS